MKRLFRVVIVGLIAIAGSVFANDAFTVTVENDTADMVTVQLGQKPSYMDQHAPTDIIGRSSIPGNGESTTSVPFMSKVDPMGTQTDSWVLTEATSGTRLVAVSCPLDMHTVVDDKGIPTNNLIIKLTGSIKDKNHPDLKAAMTLNPNLTCVFSPLRG